MGKVKVECDWCGLVFGKYAKKVTAHNFCCRACLWAFYSKKLNRRVGPRISVYTRRRKEHDKEVMPDEV